MDELMIVAVRRHLLFTLLLFLCLTQQQGAWRLIPVAHAQNLNIEVPGDKKAHVWNARDSADLAGSTFQFQVADAANDEVNSYSEKFGLGVWDPGTNLFLHSSTPSTQNIKLGAGNYTLQVEGAGHVYTVLSGVPDLNNRGNGVSTYVTPLVGATRGLYEAIFIDDRNYLVTDPAGRLVGTGAARSLNSPQALAPNFANNILFGITEGAKPFAKGDRFFLDIGAGCGAGPRMPCRFTLSHRQSVEFRVRGNPSKVWLTPSLSETPYIASGDSPGIREKYPDVALLPATHVPHAIIARFRIQSLANDGGDRVILQADDGNDGNAIRFRISNNKALAYVDVIVGGKAITSIPTQSVYPSTYYVIGASWRVNSITVVVDGKLYAANLPVSSIPSLKELRFGSAADGSGSLNGYLSRVEVEANSISPKTLQTRTNYRSIIMPKEDFGCAWNNAKNDAACVQEALLASAEKLLPIVWPCGSAYVDPSTSFVLPEDVVTYQDISCSRRPRMRLGPTLAANVDEFVGRVGDAGGFYLSGITFDGSSATFSKDYLTDPQDGAPVTDPATDPRRNPEFLRTRSLFSITRFRNPVVYNLGLENWQSFGLAFRGIESPMIGDIQIKRVGHFATPSSSILFAGDGISRPIVDVVPGGQCTIIAANRLPNYFDTGSLVKITGLNAQGPVIPDGTYKVIRKIGDKFRPGVVIDYNCAGFKFAFDGKGVISTPAYKPTTNALVATLASNEGIHDPIQVSAQVASVVYSTRHLGGGGFVYANGAIDFSAAFCDVLDSSLVGSVVSDYDCEFTSGCQLLSNRAEKEQFQGIGGVGSIHQVVSGNFIANFGGAISYPYNPFNERYGGLVLGKADGQTTRFAFRLDPLPKPGGTVIISGAHLADDGRTPGVLRGDAILSGKIDYSTGLGTIVYKEAPAVRDNPTAYYVGALGTPIAGKRVKPWQNSAALFIAGRSYPSSVKFENNTVVDSSQSVTEKDGVAIARAGKTGVFNSLSVKNNDFTGVSSRSLRPWVASDPRVVPQSVFSRDNSLPK